MRDFNHSVNVLVKAYLNNTLEHCNCHACAVGNLIADANNIEITNTNADFYLRNRWKSSISPEWYGYIKNYTFANHDQAISEIKSTGYSVGEVIKIESAFEHASIATYNIYESLNEEWMFEGLMAVVDVLADIHGIDLKQREEAKALFVK